MGTAVRVELWHPDETVGRAAIDAVMRDMHRIDRLMSTYKEDSELSRVNRELVRLPGSNKNSIVNPCMSFVTAIHLSCF